MGTHVFGDIVTRGSSVLCSHSGDPACTGDSALAHWAADPANTAWMDSKHPAPREPPARGWPSPCPARGADGPRARPQASDLWFFPEALTRVAITVASVLGSPSGPSSRAPGSCPLLPVPFQRRLGRLSHGLGLGAWCSNPGLSQPVPTETNSPVPARHPGATLSRCQCRSRVGGGWVVKPTLARCLPEPRGSPLRPRMPRWC